MKPSPPPAVAARDTLSRSLGVLAQPQLYTFDRFKPYAHWNATLSYLGLGALVSGAVAGLFGLPSPLAMLLAFVVGAVSTALLYLVITGLLYGAGRLLGGNSRLEDLAYLTALFLVPLLVLGQLANLLPGFLGTVAALLLLGLLLFFSFLAVQSALNLRQPLKAALAVGGMLLGLFVLSLPLFFLSLRVL